MPDRLLEYAIQLQRIPAPTFHEGKRAACLQDMLRSAGIPQTRMDAAGNIVAIIPGVSPPLIVSAHLDTVFGVDVPHTLRQTATTLHAPGIGDNTISLAALVQLGTELAAAPLHHSVVLVGNVGEEGLGNLAGMRAVVDRFGNDVIAYLVLEGFSQDVLVTQAINIRRYRVSVETQGGHPWAHPQRPSAIHLLAKLANTLTSPRRRRKGRLTVNIGRIEGGTSINSIAASASMQVDVRSIKPLPIHHFEGSLHQLCSSIEVEGSSITCECIGERPGGEIPSDAPLVQQALEALHSAGISPVKMATGSTDANIPLSLGYPAVCMGLTYGGDAHTTEEYIEIEPLHKGYAALKSLVTRLAKEP